MSQSGSYRRGVIPAIPVTVPQGGTGLASLTDHSVLVGSGVAPITPIAVGATGTLLVGAVGADPAFGTSATGNFTFTSSTANQARSLTVVNTDNTIASTAAARLDITVGGTNVGDPQIKYRVTGASTWSHGVDNSELDKFKISASATLGTADTFIMTTNGELTKPLQPAFLAYLGTSDNLITGDFTAFRIGSANPLTEVYDQNSDFNTNGTFTAPITGRYLFTGAVRCSDLTAAHTVAYVQLVTSNGTYTSLLISGGVVKITPGDSMIIPIVAQADMNASDTAVIELVVGGGARVVDAVSNLRETRFAGQLLC